MSTPPRMKKGRIGVWMLWPRDRFLLVPKSQQERLIRVYIGTTQCCPLQKRFFCDGARRGEALFMPTHARCIPWILDRKSSRNGSLEMEILYTCCAGCDVHKKIIKVCLLTRDKQGKSQKEFRTYATTTEELLNLSDWLKEHGCTHVAMEGTGVYWKPVYNLLEGNFEMVVVNAQHMKAVPGRKTDTKDEEWIADLLHHGLLKASFIPSVPQRELRELTRYCVRLTEERAREVNRVQKTLGDTNIKLGDVVSDVTRTTLTAIPILSQYRGELGRCDGFIV